MKSIISASRRTDIPAFYLPWLISCLKNGYADVITPMAINKRVDLHKDKIHTIVLCSKNFGPFLKHREHFRDYHLFFNFTVNDSPLLEPHVPGIEERLKQMEALVHLYGPERIYWRFDPIVFWNGGKENNLSSYTNLLMRMSRLGIKRCVFSFFTPYRSVINRAEKLKFNFYDPPYNVKLETAMWMAKKAKEVDIELCVCCQNEFVGLGNIRYASCIDGPLLSLLSGERASFAKDRSQRQGCHCTRSIDIGSYTLPCPHGCLYCYANPTNLSP